MAHSVTHSKVSAVADSGNTSLVQPSDWNADHVVTVDASLVDHGSLAGLSDDDHTSYHTDARALTWLGTRSTTDLAEGTNLYYTDERVDDRVSSLIQNGTGISWSYNDGLGTLTPTVSLAAFSTTNLSEGTNLYFTDARADARVAVHTGDTTDAHAASAITNTPAGNIAATTVQAAINELDTEKQPLDAGLTDIAALAVTDGNFIVGDGANWVAESGATARTSLGLGALATLATVGTTQIDAAAVTYAKIQNVSATDKLLGRSTAGAGTVEEITCTAAGRALLDDATASDQRTTLGLGTAATQNTGTSGANVPLLNTSVTFSGGTFTSQRSGAQSALVLERTDTHGDLVNVSAISFYGRDSGGASQLYTEMVGVCISDNAGAENGRYVFTSTQSGTTATRLLIDAGLWHPSATGGDKGNNTINFGAVYDDNTLLTCYVFDAVLDGGKINLKKWDDLTPNVDYEDTKPDGSKERIFIERAHEPLRKFAARLGGAEDPLDLDKYINHWKTKRHLTSMPNEANFDPVKGLPTGAWIQRLVETAEIQAVHIAHLLDRIKSLEATARLK